MSKPDGGLAFPKGGMNTSSQQGMTLRDYFAAKAMQGILACTKYHFPQKPEGGEVSRGILAEEAFAQADAMLAERSK